MIERIGGVARDELDAAHRARVDDERSAQVDRRAGRRPWTSTSDSHSSGSPSFAPRAAPDRVSRGPWHSPGRRAAGRSPRTPAAFSPSIPCRTVNGSSAVACTRMKRRQLSKPGSPSGTSPRHQAVVRFIEGNPGATALGRADRAQRRTIRGLGLRQFGDGFSHVRVLEIRPTRLGRGPERGRSRATASSTPRSSAPRRPCACVARSNARSRPSMAVPMATLSPFCTAVARSSSTVEHVDGVGALRNRLPVERHRDETALIDLQLNGRRVAVVRPGAGRTSERRLIRRGTGEERAAVELPR